MGVWNYGAVNQEKYQHRMKIRRAFRDSALAGALRPAHLRGYKPAA